MNLKTKLFFFSVLFFTGYFVFTAFVFEVEKIDQNEKVNDVLNKLGDEMLATPTICGNQLFMRVAHRKDDQRQEVLYCIGE